MSSTLLLMVLALQQTPAEAAAPAAAPGAMAPIPNPDALPPAVLTRSGVSIDRYDRARVEGQRSPEDQAYEATVRSSAAVAQSRLGSLDGGWLVTDATGKGVLSLQMVDTGPFDAVEGAWREAGDARGSAPRRSGFIAMVGREPARTVIRFLEPGASAPTVLSLEPALDGSWRGQMEREGATAPVVMRRR